MRWFSDFSVVHRGFIGVTDDRLEWSQRWEGGGGGEGFWSGSKKVIHENEVVENAVSFEGAQ